MPASVCDPVSNALRLSLSNDHSSAGDVLDNRLIASAKTVLLTKIDFEESGNYQSNLLEGLKSKYVVIRPKKPSADGKIVKNDAESSPGVKGECKLPAPQRVLFPFDSVSFGWSGKDFQVGCGMINLGNSCYLNSTLQALFHVPAFANWLMSDSQHLNKCNHSEGCIVCSMRSVLVATQRSNGPIKPWQVYSKLRLICRHLVPGRQEDAHEFLRYLIEAMEKSFLSRYGNSATQLDQYSKETTPLNQILGGYLRSAVRCLTCGHVSTTFQHFQDLLLDIRKAATMDDALDTFFSRERLEDLGYKCEACNKKVSATKQFYIERAPAVLCIALKRFSLGSGKLSKHISYRPHLSLNKYSFHKNKVVDLNYRLVALVTHLGPSNSCGHYTAVGHTSSGTFHQFDDSCVRSLPISSVLATNAYIMFYEMDKTAQNKMDTSANTSPVVYGPKLPNNHYLNRPNVPHKILSVTNGAGNPPPNFNSPPKSILKNGNATNGHSNTNENGNCQMKKQPIMQNFNKGVKIINDMFCDETNGHNRHRDAEPTASSSTDKSPNGKCRTDRDSKSPSNKSSGSGCSSFSSETNCSRLVPYDAESSDDEDDSFKTVKKTANLNENYNITSTGKNNWTVSVENSAATSTNQNNIKTFNEESTPKKPSDSGVSSSTPKTEAQSSNGMMSGHQTLNHLQQLSHRGYGAPVSTWNGTKANLTKETIDEKRFERKRALNGVDEMDGGRMKKMRYNKFNRFDRMKNGYNPFQENQNRQHQNQNSYWTGGNNNVFNGGNQERGQFYHHQYQRNNRGHSRYNQNRYRNQFQHYPRHR